MLGTTPEQKHYIQKQPTTGKNVIRRPKMLQQWNILKKQNIQNQNLTIRQKIEIQESFC